MEIRVRIKTLTPIWTGGSDGTTDRVHTTGVIGSLRWWHEAIVRGLGGWACDPTTDRRCTLEQQRLHDAVLCDTCRIFGAEGWRRRFQVQIVDDQTVPIWNDLHAALTIRPHDRMRGWDLYPGRMGEFTLVARGEAHAIRMLASLLLWVERWGSLGARSQLGYGSIRILNREEIAAAAQHWQWTPLPQGHPITPMPDLRQFGFFYGTITPEQPGWWALIDGISRVAPQVQPMVTTFGVVPITPVVKNMWRFRKWNATTAAARTVFGYLDAHGRTRGRVAVSWAYRDDTVWHVRGWVQMPDAPTTQQEVWRLIGDHTIWHDARIPLTHLTCVPTTATWQAWSDDDVAAFLTDTVASATTGIDR